MRRSKTRSKWNRWASSRSKGSSDRSRHSTSSQFVPRQRRFPRDRTAGTGMLRRMLGRFALLSRKACTGQPHLAHLAHIPWETTGSSRQVPAIPATAASESPALWAIPAYSRRARICQDRPVTPEVAGSSRGAPVSEGPAHAPLVWNVPPLVRFQRCCAACCFFHFPVDAQAGSLPSSVC